ncbi:hypothetical protein LTR56_022833 [Elasticomyces elasticus]|nr:hypothetical protein LTR56_022833 [Elasticomyces elasticus]KAK3627474.1 hypothetical protein LTR22_022750 [Elasticomyces elasticus]KAK4907633.1 hypothetical protein LTR49_023386 [Elasticomyces elasticus]KAK5753447.1 hypothetical protein LTS12_016498 [Elasticomyces elasticus]
MPFLPDDVFLVVVGHTDIDTFLDLRSLSRHVGALITAIVVERQMPGAEITAEDPLGDDLRRAIAKGWRVLTHCSKMAREVALISPEYLPQRSHHGGRTQGADTAETEELREIEAYRRYSLYFETLQIEDLKGYEQLQRILVLRAFGLKWHNRVELGIYKDLPGNAEHDQWVSSYLLRLGARPFWQDWWATSALPPRTSVKETIEAAWDLRNDAMRLSERQNPEVLQHQIWTMAHDIEYRLWSRTPTQHRAPPEITALLNIPTSHVLGHQRKLLTERRVKNLHLAHSIVCASHKRWTLESLVLRRTCRFRNAGQTWQSAVV